MTGENRRRWADVADDGGITLPQRLERIEHRQDKADNRQLIMIVMLVANLFLSANDALTKLPTILKAFGL